ncbi:hypothetical protein ACIRYZ_42695 [Kitasatospora sp. NPDC101155]|uniref:hypothetical protein n=1 Tax=Kitasatospora sp. NPDC101155 TaxID=3364097 RepID=UPI00380575F3
MRIDSPAYCVGDILQETVAPGRRMRVLTVGEESYFVRLLADTPAGTEPREWASAYEDCERYTRLIGLAGD